MGRCINHPERKACYKCIEHNIYFCDECPECLAPDLYCKYRPSCHIWFIIRDAQNLYKCHKEAEVNGCGKKETARVTQTEPAVSGERVLL